MFFKKKVPLKEFCRQKFDFILSQEGRSLADKLRNRCGTDFAAQANADDYLEHFRGAFLELVGVAFSRTLTRDQRFEVSLFTNEYLKSSGCPELEYVHRLYNSAFASSPVDGIEQMAIFLAEHVQSPGADRGTVVRVHHDGFYEILNGLFREIKKINLV